MKEPVKRILLLLLLLLRGCIWERLLLLLRNRIWGYRECLLLLTELNYERRELIWEGI
jgi:hypothetical protein